MAAAVGIRRRIFCSATFYCKPLSRGIAAPAPLKGSLCNAKRLFITARSRAGLGSSLSLLQYVMKLPAGAAPLRPLRLPRPCGPPAVPAWLRRHRSATAFLLPSPLPHWRNGGARCPDSDPGRCPCCTRQGC